MTGVPPSHAFPTPWLRQSRRPQCNGEWMVWVQGASQLTDRRSPCRAGGAPTLCSLLVFMDLIWLTRWKQELLSDRDTLNPVPPARDFLSLMKSLQRATAGRFYTAEMSGMQPDLGNSCLFHLATTAGHRLPPLISPLGPSSFHLTKKSGQFQI